MCKLARRSDRSRDRATVSSPGGSSVPVAVGHQAMLEQTDAYDSMLKRLDSMKHRMRARAQTMADMLSDLAG